MNHRLAVLATVCLLSAVVSFAAEPSGPMAEAIARFEAGETDAAEKAFRERSSTAVILRTGRPR